MHCQDGKRVLTVHRPQDRLRIGMMPYDRMRLACLHGVDSTRRLRGDTLVASFDEAEFAGAASFGEAKFARDASFDEARVRIGDNAILDERRSWPNGLAVLDPPTEQDATLPNQDGRWGYLKTTAGDKQNRQGSNIRPVQSTAVQQQSTATTLARDDLRRPGSTL